MQDILHTSASTASLLAATDCMRGRKGNKRIATWVCDRTLVSPTERWGLDPVSLRINTRQKCCAVL